MFSTFSDPFLSDCLQMDQDRTEEDENLNFASDDLINELFPNLPSPGRGESMPLFSELGLSGLEKDGDDNFSPEIIFDDNVVQLNDEGDRKTQDTPQSNYCDEEEEDESSDDESQDSALEKISHDHFVQTKSSLPPVIRHQEKSNFVSNRLSEEQKRKFVEYYGNQKEIGLKSTIRPTFKAEADSSFELGREITVGGNRSSKISFKTGTKSRGALYAKQYRQKNKEFTDHLQQNIDQLSEENSDLKQTVEEMSGQMSNLHQEISYLRSVLANQSQLSGLLKSVTNTPGMKFRFPVVSDNDNRSTRATSKKRKAPADFDNSTTTGVCLHVNGDSVSLEFCARCAKDSRCDN